MYDVLRKEEVHHYNTRQRSNPRVHKWNTALGNKKLFILEPIFGPK